MLSLPWAARRLDATSEPAGRAILLGALLLRLPLLPLPPTLSDDVLRYLWDGRVAAAGQNPYLLSPAAPELTPLRDDLWRRLPHRQIPTVYPPLAVAAFSIAARLPFPILSWKLLVTGADLAACALLLRLARQLGLPAGRTVWYAWNPMVALEVAGHGHVDILGVAAALAVVSILLARRVPWVRWGGSVGVRPEGPGGSRPFGVGTGESGEARGGIAAERRSSRRGLRAPLPAPPGEPPPNHPRRPSLVVDRPGRSRRGVRHSGQAGTGGGAPHVGAPEWPGGDFPGERSRSDRGGGPPRSRRHG